ncbi:MAG: LysM peptidoglycan-binding domain-containing protein, partial [Burkholderiaceae bacterium]
LALAAYNWGEGNVARAISKNQKANRPTGYEDLDMPAETRLYVPKLQALKNIIGAPQDFATSFPVILNHPYFQAVTITHDIDVEQVARLAEVDIADFKALNPSIDRPVVMAAGTPQILLPWDNAAVFETNLRAAGDAPLASWTVWKAPSTMKAEDAARQVGMSAAELRAVNHIPSRMLIKAGSTLLVPRADSVHHDVDETVADNGQVSLSPEVMLLRKTLKAGKNDSVASVARRYHLQASSVAKWNQVGVKSSFKRGQSITVYLPARAEHVVPLHSKPKAHSRAKAGSAKARKGKPRRVQSRHATPKPRKAKAAKR